MSKICTSLGQSKKLMELGININSADMYWEYDFTEHECVLKIMDANFDDTCIPAWSLSALLDIYPIVVGKDMDTYCCWYNKKNLQLRRYENPIDAAFEMIVKIESMHSTMKQYTDIEQSTKLIELPIE